MDNARLLVFEAYCRIHQCIDLRMLAAKLNMDESAAEKWVVNLIRNADLNAKINSQVTRSFLCAGCMKKLAESPVFEGVISSFSLYGVVYVCSFDLLLKRRILCMLQEGTVIMDTSFPSAYESIIDKTKGLSVRTFMLANAIVGTSTAAASVRG